MTTQIISKTPIIKPEDLTIEDLRHMSKDSFPMWCLTSGAKLDNQHEVEFESHRYLLPLYADNSSEIVICKAAQMGLTSYALLRILWWLYNNQGCKAGFYFPTKEGVDNLSKDRLTPLIESVPPLAAMYDPGDKLGLRRLGKSTFYLYHLGGVASKDSVPLDYLTFDEVRLCKDKDVDQTLERISHSKHKFKVFLSTCGLPSSSIQRRYEFGKQYVYRSFCGCPDGTDLARTWPDCAVADDPRRPGEVYFRCVKCRWEIRDPQNGRYVCTNPNGDYNSYHMSQLLSKTMNAKEIWTFWKRTTHISEFYNAKLGLPYVNEENRGVSQEELEACIDTSLEWAKPSDHDNFTAMGVDHGPGYCVVVIADQKGGRKRIRHVEIIEEANPDYYELGMRVSPFKRVAQLIKEYNVRLALVDSLPNPNEVFSLVRQFPGRVFLAWYAKGGKDPVVWADKKKIKESLRKAGPLLRMARHTVTLNRFTTLSLALGEWSAGNVAMPEPRKLRQMALDEKHGQLVPECPGERLFSHLKCLLKDVRTKDGTGEETWEWHNTGPDHLAHAWNYCNTALERLKRRSTVVFV